MSLLLCLVLMIGKYKAFEGELKGIAFTASQIRDTNTKIGEGWSRVDRFSSGILVQSRQASSGNLV
jgi:hypothetical protein